MNNKFYDIPVDWYKEFNNTFNVYDEQMNMNKMNDMSNLMGMNDMNSSMGMNSLANPEEALERGNLFNNLYDPYKNYRYRNLRASNKREELLYEVMKYKFAMKELNLYLDMHPNDSSMISLYNKYMKEEKKASDEYEKMFGPLTLDSMALNSNSWRWIESPWPWEGTR